MRQFIAQRLLSRRLTNIQNAEIDRFRFRVKCATAFVLLGFALLLSRLVYLQIARNDYYSTRAEDNRISLIPILPSRGTILDRNGEVLARNYSAFTLEITPALVENLEETIAELEKLVEIQPKDKRRFQRLVNEGRPFDSQPIRIRLTDEEIALFTVNRYRFHGVEVKARLFRHYPFGATASHVLGYLNRVNKADLEMIDEKEQSANYKGTSHIGKTGIEKAYEFHLHGETGYEEVEIDANGHPVRRLSSTPPVAGNDLTLTLDIRLQEVAEKAFGKRRGALVAIDPSTGEVLAFVSMPTFDLNLFDDGISQENWDRLNNSPDRPMINRVLNATYPPGSTFKPFMALAGLESGKRTPEYSFHDTGSFTIAGHTFRDQKKDGHGHVDLYKSIVQSCDTYYYILANEMGIDSIVRFMGRIGFGQRTGIDVEGESEGLLPSPEWKRRRFRRYELQRWFTGDTVSIGIGQGYNAYTPIQIAQAVAVLANDGALYRPRLVKDISDNRAGVKKSVAPELVRTMGWQQKNIDTVKRAMAGVNREGTAARAFLNAEYTSGGKTGTAQTFSLRGGDYRASRLREELRDHALYIAFAPEDKPRIALAVLVENSGFGGQSAAPLARKVLDHFFSARADAPTAAPAVVSETRAARRGL
ncbi:MAG: penicillin-binding protein 2 [Candidatus Accumulibacter sp.]|nr:penicillin-binding protein 2 [Accumulibacter sp.]